MLCYAYTAEEAIKMAGYCLVMAVVISCVLFFFFQAEDGIRDGRVTEVQTCALPISSRRHSEGRRRQRMPPARSCDTSLRVGRSEERRVGKSVDLGGRRIIKKKKKKKSSETKRKRWKKERMRQ